MSEHTIAVNGTVYDAVTGKPLRVERGQQRAAEHSAAQVHAPLQKSRTLNRRYVRADKPAPVEQAAPVAMPVASHQISVRTKRTAPITVTKSEQVTRFGAPVVKKPVHTSSRVMDIAPAPHHLVERAQKRTAEIKPVKQEKILKPSQLIKQEAIASATEKMSSPVHAKQKNVKVPRQKTSFFARFASIGAASIAVLVLGGYFTYLSMPTISTRVAATQAGINASYPGYQPSGYSLSGPVAYQQGSVTMKFAANASTGHYTLSQTRSDWDSSAVLDNYVTPHAGKDYSTTKTGGLTIYSYGTNAAWVNDGILYTIEGDAPLSEEQVGRIATSL